MKPLLFLALNFLCLPAMAQLRKVETAFKKQEFERCISYCQQAKPGGDKEEYRRIKMYQCQSYLHLYQKTHSRVSYLDQALQIHRTENFGKTAPTDELWEAFLKTLRYTTDSLHQRKKTDLAKKYVKIQASQFKDTTYLYTLYFPAVPKAVPVAKKEAVVKETTVKISRTELLRYSEQFLNIPYKWAGEDSSGMDCSGFVWKVYGKFGYLMAHGSRDQSELGEMIPREKLKQGDLVFFGKKYDTGRCKIDHVAIVHEVSDTKLVVIHSTSKGVNIQEMKPEEYWSKKILFYRNLIDHFTLPNTDRL